MIRPATVQTSAAVAGLAVSLMTIAAPAHPRLPSGPTLHASEVIRHADPRSLFLRSAIALVMDEGDGTILYGRKVDKPHPIASLTKLMTAIVVRDADLPLEATIEVVRADRDQLRGSSSRLRYGTVATRLELLRTALAASDNRAAAALARTYPGGRTALVRAMNHKARQLGMTQTRFTDPTGLDRGNRSTARDLAKLGYASRRYPLISTLSTTGKFRLTDRRRRTHIEFRNTNYLVRRDSWKIELSKTGYTADAGHCLLMRTTIAGRPLIVVLLNSWGKLSKFGDSNRIRKWLLSAERRIRRLHSAAESPND